MIIEVSAITPGIGAEITGLDISQPLDKDTIARLRELFLRHLVLVFRDQVLSREDHKSSLIILPNCMCTHPTGVA